MKSQPGPPMRLGNAAAARVRLIMWCKACGRQVEPMLPRWPSGTGPTLLSSIGASGPGSMVLLICYHDPMWRVESV